jgi:hypothetical protein
METNTTLRLSKEIEEIIQKVENGLLNNILHELKDSYLGIYYPTMINEEGIVIPIPKGFTQLENDLEVTVSEQLSSNAVRVGWNIKQEGGLGCNHCSRHGGPVDCRHCENHGPGTKRMGNELLLDAEELDPSTFEAEADKYQTVLKSVGAYGFGLYVLHGHTDEKPFTKLPLNTISVIIDGKTEFLSRSEVLNSESFVPNMWRYVDGKCQVAGGFM